MEIEDHKIVEFKGSYAEWLEWKERREAEKIKAQKTIEINKPEIKPVSKIAVSTANNKQQTGNSSVDKEIKKEYQKHKSRFIQVEEKIARLTKQKTDLETAMASPDSYSNKEKFQRTELDYNKATAELADLNKEYETLFEKVMELEEKMQ